MLYRHCDLVPDFGRRWRVNLAAANLLILPVMLGLVMTGTRTAKVWGDACGLMYGGFAAAVVYTWLMIPGLWRAFLHYFSRERAWVR